MLGRTSSVVAAVSAAAVWANSGGTPAATAGDWRPRKLSELVRLATVEREREGSAVKSVQRMNAHLAALCREKKARMSSADTRW